MTNRHTPAALVSLLALCGCSAPADVSPRPSVDDAALDRHYAQLEAPPADGPVAGSPAEQRAVEYITGQLRGYGLETTVQDIPIAYLRTSATPLTLTVSPAPASKTATPGGIGVETGVGPATGTDAGMGVQADVPLEAGARPQPDTTAQGASRTLVPGADYVAWSERPAESVVIDADLVFAGHGVVAPELGWDDYKDLDVRGKIVVLLSGHPYTGHPDALDIAETEYYGRYGFKFEEAARRGAEGALIIHDEAATGESWEVLRASAPEWQLHIDDPTLDGATPLGLEGWITPATAAGLAGMAGLDLNELVDDARLPNFVPVPLGITARKTFTSTVDPRTGHNAIGLLRGTGPEFVIVSARWNRLAFAGETADEAAAESARSPSAPALLELARALAALPQPLLRSVVFLAVTAEHDGLLGSRYYMNHPVYPPSATRGHIYLDEVAAADPQSLVRRVGTNVTAISHILRESAAAQARMVVPDSDQARGRYFRYSQPAFIRQGVSSLVMSTATPPDVEPVDDAVLARTMAGAAQDTRLLFDVVVSLANATNLPTGERPGLHRRVGRTGTSVTARRR